MKPIIKNYNSRTNSRANNQTSRVKSSYLSSL